MTPHQIVGVKAFRGAVFTITKQILISPFSCMEDKHLVEKICGQFSPHSLFNSIKYSLPCCYWQG
jgi:hypothetical protein